MEKIQRIGRLTPEQSAKIRPRVEAAVKQMQSIQVQSMQQGSDALDAALAEIVAAALAADPDAAAKVRDGNMKAVGPLVGYVMRETKGRADGGAINRLIREQLGI